MAQYIQLPNGAYFELKEGQSPIEGIRAAQELYPDAFKTEPPKPKQDTTGFKAAAAAGLESLKGEAALTAGKIGVMDADAAEQYYQKRQAAARERFTPTEAGWTESPWLKFKETAGGSLPYMAAPAAAGLAALAAPVAAPTAALIGAGAAGLANFGQFTGTNLARQMDTGKTLAQTDLSAAAGAAVPQALLDTAAMALMPGVGKLFGSVGTKLTTEEARAIASQTLGKAVADYTAKTGAAMGREGITETAQQVLERLQAGLSITDPEARKEYIDSFIGGAALAGAGAPVGRTFERRAAKSQAAEEDRKDRLLAAQEALRAQTEAADAEEARRNDPAELLKLEQTYNDALQQRNDLKAQIRKASKGQELTPEDKAFNTAVFGQLKELTPTLAELGKEVAARRPQINAAKEQQRTQAMSSEDFMLEQLGVPAAAEVAPTAPPKMRTVVDEYGQINEVPETPVAEAETPLPGTQYLTGQVEAARNMGVMDLGDLADFAMQDPVMAAQAVKESAGIEGLSPQENGALLGGLRLRLKALEKQEAAQVKGELGQRTADIQQQKVDTATDMPQQQVADMYEAQDTTLREGETNLDYLDGMFETALAGDEPVVKVDPAVTPVRNAQALRARVDSLEQEIAAAQEAASAAKQSRNPQGVVDARRKVASLNDQLQSMGQQGGAYPAQMMALRRAQQETLARLADVADQLRSGQTLSGPNKAMAASTEQTLRNQAEVARAKLVQTALQEAALHRRASGAKPLTRDEALIAASKLSDTVNTMMERAATKPAPAQTEEVVVEPAQMRANKVVRGAQTERRLVTPAQQRMSPAEQAHFNQRLQAIIENLTAPAQSTAQVADTGVLRQQFASTEAAKVAEARGETAATLSGELRRRAEYVSNLLEKAIPKAPAGGTLEYTAPTGERIVENVERMREVLQRAKNMIEDGVVTRALLDAAENQATRVLNGQDLNQVIRTERRVVSPGKRVVDNVPGKEGSTRFGTRGEKSTTVGRFESVEGDQSEALRELQDVMAGLSRQAQEGETVGRIEGQKELFDTTTDRSRRERELGIVRSTAANFENAPAVQKARMAIERAANAAKLAQEKARQEATVKEAKRTKRVEAKAVAVEAQREDLQKAIYDALNQRRSAFKAAAVAVDPEVKAANKALDAADKDLADMYDQVQKAGNVADALKLAGDIVKRREALAEARTKLDKALADTRATYDGAALVAAAHQDSLVQFERGVLAKMEKELAKLEKAEVPAATKRIEAQRANAAKAETDARNAADVAAKEKRQLDQRLASGLGLPGLKRVAGEVAEIETAKKQQRDAEQAEIEKNLDAALESISGNKLLVPQRARVTGPVTRSTQKAPAQLRSGTAESRAGEGRTSTKQTLEEPRTPARSERAITAAEQEEANAIAERLKEDAAEANKLAQQIKGTKAKPEPQPSTRVQRGASPKTTRAARAVEDVYSDFDDEAELIKKPGRPPAPDTKQVPRVAPAVKPVTAASSPAQITAALTRRYGVGIDETAEFNGMTFAQAARYGAKRTTSTMVRQLFERLAEVFEQAPEKEQGLVLAADAALKAPGGLAAGIYATALNTILTVAPSVRAGANKTLLHELTHAATVRGLVTDTELNDRVTDLRQRVVDWLETPQGRAYFRKHAMELQAKNRQDVYGLKNNKEFLAELFADRAFQKMLTEIPSDKPRKSILTRFVQALAKFFNSPGEAAQSAFAEAVALTEEVLEVTVREVYAGRGASVAEVADAPQRIAGARAATPAMDALAGKTISGPKSWKDKWSGASALAAEQAVVDMRAALREVTKVGDAQKFEQAMNSVLKADQKMPLIYTTLGSGPLTVYKDAKGLRGVKSTNQNSAIDVFNAISELPVDADKKMTVAQAYMVAQRANNKGLSRLDIGALGVTQAELDAVLAEADANPTLNAALKKVRAAYNAYNKGLIDFNVQTGAMTAAEAAKLNKAGDYVPFYRVDANGKASLVFSDDTMVTIGDIRRQPYLAQLKGGQDRLLPLDEAIFRNTTLLVDKALTNMASRNVAYALQAIGRPAGKMQIHTGDGPSDPHVMRFRQEPDPANSRDDGSRWIKLDTEGTMAEGVPTELLVKSVEGAHLPLPGFLKLAGSAADLLRSGITRMPPYIFRQLLRDPMAASFTAGLNYSPFTAVFKAGKEFVASTRGTSTTQAKLVEKGLVQSGIFSGDADDISKIALQIVGKDNMGAMDRVFAALDRAAMRADAATRALVYENALNNGLSEVEADTMTMESMNFYKRGTSASVQYASRLIPFLNAQIQGLNVLYKAATGKMPFEEQQRIKRKFFNNAVLLFSTGLVYAMLMEDDEDFRNARPRDKYTNFFLPIPGVGEMLKLPIPYEAGYFFSLAVAAVDGMREETRTKEQFEALRDMFIGSIPGASSMYVPQIVKPLAEVFTNKNFFNGAPIESQRLQAMDVTQRYNANTTELAKAMSKALPLLSPIQIEHIVRGYLGVAPLAAAAMANDMFAPETKGAAIEKRASDLPLVGSMFQKKYGGADTDAVYDLANAALSARTTLNTMLKEGRREEAIAFRDAHRNELAAVDVAGSYRQIVGRINVEMRRLEQREDMTSAEKASRRDALEKAKQDAATKFLRVVRVIEEGKTKPQ